MTAAHIPAERLDRYKTWHSLAAPYFRWQYEQFAPWVGDRVADVGCGPGNLTPSLLDRAAYLGVDHDPAMLAGLMAEFGQHANVATLALDVSDPALASELRRRNIDTVLCANLLEHLPQDEQVLANLVAGLPVGGKLCVLVPAHPFLYGTLDALDGHVRRYTKRSVERLLGTQPLRIHQLGYFNMIGAVGWLVAGRIRQVRAVAGSNYRAMNRLIPMMRAVEHAVPPPFGLSVIAVAEKVA